MVKVGDYVALKGKGWGSRKDEVVRVTKIVYDNYAAGFYPDIMVEGYDSYAVGPYPGMGSDDLTYSYEPIGQSIYSSGTPTPTVTKPTLSLVPEGTDEPLKLAKEDIDAIAEVVIQKLKARL